MNWAGLLLGASAFLCIGMFHPIVIKAEYYFGVRCWWVFAIVGTAAVCGSLFIENTIASSIVGVFGFSAFWSILEVFEQRKRVLKGWFPMNPKRKQEYEDARCKMHNAK